MTAPSVYDEAPAAWALWQWVVARVPETEVSEFANRMRAYRDEIQQSDQQQIHAAQCGPARGGFKVCYCTAPCCHPIRDGQPLCICPDCRATNTCPGNQKEQP